MVLSHSSSTRAGRRYTRPPRRQDSPAIQTNRQGRVSPLIFISLHLTNRKHDQRAGKYVIDWGQELEAQYQAWVTEHGHRSTATTATKRSAPDGSAAPAKKIKSEKNADGPSEEEMRARFEKSTIDKLTLAVLKEFAITKGIDTKGKKGDLVERVQEYFENK
jgi:ATP-dependent DNA helicase 2 subunit 1